MKVLNIIQRYSPAVGGAETWCGNVSRFMVSKGMVVKVSAMNLYNLEEFYTEAPSPQPYVKLGSHDFDNGVFVTRYGLWNFYSPGPAPRISRLIFHKLRLERTDLGIIFKHSPHSWKMYRNLLRDIRDADIVHLQGFPYFHNIPGYFAARIMGKPVVITPHFHPGNPQYEKRLFYRILNKTDAVLAMTGYEKEYLVSKGVDADKIHVTGNVASDTGRQDLEGAFTPSTARLKTLNDKKAKKLIFIGRKEPYKGIATLIEAARNIAEEAREEILLFLVGPDTAEFTRDHPDLGNMGKLKVINFGRVSEEEKEELLRMSDLLVLPSEFEAFGIVFLEAWRYNKPVIGTDRGAVPGLIKGAGLCVRYGDAQDLKEKIKSIIFDEKLALKLGAAGRNKLKDYSPEKIGGKVLDVYCSLRKRKRVLIVSHLFHPYFIGGSEVVAYEQSKMLKKRGFEVKVFGGRINNKSKSYLPVKERGRFEVMRFDLKHEDFDCNLVDFNKPQLLEGFRKTLFESAPDVVHFHNIYPLSIKMIEVCKAMHIPAVMTLHDFWGICFKNILLTNQGAVCDKRGIECIHCQRDLRGPGGGPVSLSERNATIMRYLNMADLLISPSSYLLNRFIDCGLSKDKAVLINYGIDLSRFKNTSKKHSSKIRFAYIGQIVWHKGIENLLRAFSLLSPAEKSSISLSLIGSGEEAFVKYCKELARELNLSEFVKFYGKMDNKKVLKMYRNIDVLIAPSIWPENSPVTIMESFASATPVLGSDIGGIPELIRDDMNGFLHKHDDPASLAANIKKIIERPQLLNEMRQACLLKAREHDLTETVKSIAGHYIRLNANN
jgi:glycosyltransferase involved in cell wall biosynthesis